MAWAQVASNRAFDFEDFSSNTFLFSDIAQSLSRQARYNGHTKLVYTVADHLLSFLPLVNPIVAVSWVFH